MHRARAHAERGAEAGGAVCADGHHTFEGGGAGLWGVCARRVRRCGGRPRRAGCRGPGTHANERKGAARVDFDAKGMNELGAGADVVVLEASNAAAGEGGGRSGADVDTADAVVCKVLRCIGREHTLSEEQSRRRGAWRRHRTSEGGGVGLGRVCEAGARRLVLAAHELRQAGDNAWCAAAGGGGHVARGAGGQARTVASAKAPSGAIATRKGR